MSCYLIVAGEAVVTTIAEKIVKKHEDKSADIHKADHSACTHSLSRKLGWLNKMLWGGSGLLAFEHLWHGELSPFFPFLTAASNPEDTAAMLHEMSTVGVSMSLLVTAVWLGAALVSDRLKKSYSTPETTAESFGEVSV